VRFLVLILLFFSFCLCYRLPTRVRVVERVGSRPKDQVVHRGETGMVYKPKEFDRVAKRWPDEISTGFDKKSKHLVFQWKHEVIEPGKKKGKMEVKNCTIHYPTWKKNQEEKCDKIEGCPKNPERLTCETPPFYEKQCTTKDQCKEVARSVVFKPIKNSVEDIEIDMEIASSFK